MDGLRNLEYRGYDSAGLALHSGDALRHVKAVGKVRNLDALLTKKPLEGVCGIAHTRWATHGEVSLHNAHPHLSGDEIALVHNGIIENHALLHTELSDAGYRFHTDTDTEVIAHLIDQQCRTGVDLATAVRHVQTRLEGSYALAVMRRSEPGHIIATRLGSPLVVAICEQGYLLASDVAAIRGVARDFIYPEEGDIISIRPTGMEVHDRDAKKVSRDVVTIDEDAESVSLGKFKHYMQKEIWEQPDVISGLLDGLMRGDTLHIDELGDKERAQLEGIDTIHIVACGTSYHAALVARYWFEEIAGISCAVDIASEFRYRTTNVLKRTLFVAISQSGETADTLAALRCAASVNYVARWAICNVPRSTLTREAEFVLFTRAGLEIGVASTKAFTTQLIMLLALCMLVARKRQGNSALLEDTYESMKQLPELMREVLHMESDIKGMAKHFRHAKSALFLGRGPHYPVAMEGALKLKEISYIHAEAYAAGELKHGPLALIDNEMPVIALVPHGSLHEKMVSNLEEVHARGGVIYAFSDSAEVLPEQLKATVVPLPRAYASISPILYALPLQIFAYHAALIRGADVDQPRNLAKSVTVE